MGLDLVPICLVYFVFIIFTIILNVFFPLSKNIIWKVFSTFIEAFILLIVEAFLLIVLFSNDYTSDASTITLIFLISLTSIIIPFILNLIIHMPLYYYFKKRNEQLQMTKEEKQTLDEYEEF